MKWTERAACRGTDTSTFFSDDADDVAAAKRICATCMVRAECLDDAFATAEHLGYYPSDEVPGVWGGLTAPERTRMRTATLRQDRMTGT